MAQPKHISLIYIIISYASDLSTGMEYILQVVYPVHLSTYADKFVHTASFWSCSVFRLTQMNDTRQGC